MKHLFTLLLLRSLVHQAHADCEIIPGSIGVAGASSVGRLTTAWVEAYNSECGVSPSVAIETGGGSSDGASRVCGTSSSSEPVDIGGMARPINSGEASTEDDWQYECARSTRTLIQVGRNKLMGNASIVNEWT